MIDINDSIFEFAYKMAFQDSTLRKAFSKNGDADGLFEFRKEVAYYCSKEFVRTYIDCIFAGDMNYNPLNTIKEVVYINKEKQTCFSFGNSQKLVNMTAKYLYMSCYEDNNKRKIFANCHCPMDGIMLELLKKKGRKYSCLKPWSSLEMYEDEIPEQYTWFQNQITELCKELSPQCLPIEYDYFYWD